MVEYLERKAVLDIMLRAQTLYGAYMAIAHMEPAKNADVVERKHGKWKTVMYHLYECSECGAAYQDVGYGFNYCPNCGAMMEESDV